MRFLYSFLLIVLVGCNSAEQKSSVLRLDLQKSISLDSLSSGSGLCFTGSGAFVMSDNMNGFFTLDTSRLVYSFHSFDSAGAHIQTKDVKEDFENAAQFEYEGQQWIIAFGSGSVENTREKILMVSAGSAERFKLINASGFYNGLKNQMGISTGQLNIEGCFTTQDSIYLLNRGTNEMICMSNAEFAKAITTHFSFTPPMNSRKYVLPVVDGYSAAFSAACYYKEDKFIFSASVEKTDNWVDDGEVAGSFIGIANIHGGIEQVILFKGTDQKKSIEKIEGIEWVQSAGKISTIYAISDNDNGKSTWFVIKCEGLN